MHRPFVTTVKFENDDGDVVRVEYAVAADDTTAAKTELEQRFVDLEIVGYTIERIMEATTFQARLFELPPRCVMLLGHEGPGTDAQAASALGATSWLNRLSLKIAAARIFALPRLLPAFTRRLLNRVLATSVWRAATAAPQGAITQRRRSPLR